MFRVDPTTKRLKVSATGVVAGPSGGSSTDNAVARWDGTGGNTLQDSVVLIGDTGAVTGVLSIAIGGGSALATSNQTGTGNIVLATSPTITTPTITTSATVPLLIGGTTTTSTLSLRSTSGVGTTGADIIFQTGNNGATEAMRILNSGDVGIGMSPDTRLAISPGLTPTGSASTYMSHINAKSATIAFQTTPQTGDFIGIHYQQATLTNPSSGTITNASTLKLDGAPIASTNVTITNPYTIWSAAGLNRFDGNTIIGTLTTPDTLLHVHNGSAGSVTAGVDTVAVFENNASCRILILSPSANSGIINFGDPASTTVGQITYDHASDEISFRIGGTSNVCNWRTTTMTFKDTFNIVVGSTTGTKIATATTQKIGFWNATPIVQPAAVGTYTNTGIYSADAAGIKTAIDGLRAVLSAALGGSGLTA